MLRQPLFTKDLLHNLRSLDQKQRQNLWPFLFLLSQNDQAQHIQEYSTSTLTSFQI